MEKLIILKEYTHPDPSQEGNLWRLFLHFVSLLTDS